MGILIIGGDGFLGNHLRAFFKSKSLPFEYTSRVVGASDYFLDLQKLPSIDALPIKSGDIVIVLAGISSPEFCEANPELSKSINCDGTAYLIKRTLIAGAKVIFASTDSVYGEQNGKLSESSPCFPVGKYALYKHAIESLFAGIGDFVSLRVSYVLADDDKFTSLLKKLNSTDEVLEVYSNFKRNIIELDDLLHGIGAIISNWNVAAGYSFINFSGPRLIGRDELAIEICNKHGLETRIRSVIGPEAFFEFRPKIIETSSDRFRELLAKARLSANKRNE